LQQQQQPRSITCQVPDGTGTENEVILIRSAKSSYVANASSSIWLNYQAPVITGVSPRKLHTYGGIITITGRNFGLRSKASAYYGTTKLSVKSTGYTDTLAYITIPAGDGKQQTLKFTVDGQSEYVSYSNPPPPHTHAPLDIFFNIINSCVGGGLTH
jgi:hypothetical protein